MSSPRATLGRLAATAGLLLILGAAVQAAPAAASPLDGKGMWIWYVSASGGSAERIAEKAKRHNIDTVFVKSGDGANYWSQFSRSLVAGLRDRGINVCAWQFVYGGDPRPEARVGARAVDAGADCFVIDAESAYEGRYSAADKYVRVLRRRIGDDFPLALTGFPYVDYHLSFPYSVFLGRGAAEFNLPQIYWKAIGTSVKRAYEHTYTWNRPYDVPIFPLGQTWQDPSHDEVIDFRRYAEEYGANGVSWWSWQETEGREWRWVGRRIRGGIERFEPEQAFPVLDRGDAGDVVIRAQQLLRAAGEDLNVDGTYGGGMVEAVRAFQEEEGLEPTGEIGVATWRALLERRPVNTRWSLRRSARVAAAAGTSPAPASASIDPLAYESGLTPGRP
jgi:hypothetical protein